MKTVATNPTKLASFLKKHHAAAHMRRAVLKQSRVRQSPRLRFVLDDSLKRAAAVDAAIREATEGRGTDGHPEDGEQDQ